MTIPTVAPPKLSFGQRMLLVLPRMGHGEKKDKQPVGDWMRKTFMKPEDPDAKPAKKVPGHLGIGRGARGHDQDCR